MKTMQQIKFEAFELVQKLDKIYNMAIWLADDTESISQAEGIRWQNEMYLNPSNRQLSEKKNELLANGRIKLETKPPLALAANE